MKIWYLYHSGFAIEIDNNILIFDYYRDRPRMRSFDEGVVNPELISNRNVSIFVSHRHSDHYNQNIYNWRYDIRRVKYLLSEDVVPPQDVAALILAPDKILELEDMTIRTLKSNDEGVAILVKINKKTIFFAGDLNWWDWAGESSTFRAKMKESYCSQIDLLGDEPIDVAFIPADPRLGEQYVLGIDYFMRTVAAQYCIPMHLDGDYSICEKLKKDPRTSPYRDRLLLYSHRGDCFTLFEDEKEEE